MACPAGAGPLSHLPDRAAQPAGGLHVGRAEIQRRGRDAKNRDRENARGATQPRTPRVRQSLLRTKMFAWWERVVKVTAGKVITSALKGPPGGGEPSDPPALPKQQRYL